MTTGKPKKPEQKKPGTLGAAKAGGAEDQKKSDSPRSGKVRPANVRQSKYVRGVLAGKTKKRAALDAGYSESTAKRTIAIDGRPPVAWLFTELLEKAGITDGLLARRIREGLDAKETKLAMRDGKITDSLTLIAFAERREMAQLALKLKGHLVDKHEIHSALTLEELLEGTHEQE